MSLGVGFAWVPVAMLLTFAAGQGFQAEEALRPYLSGSEPRPGSWDEAGDAAALPLWEAGKVPGEIPGRIGAEYTTQLTGPNDLAVHNVTFPTITPYLVKGADSAVVIAPGGAYSILAINREGTDIAAWLNGIGVSAFVLKYRVPARDWLSFGAAPLMDAQRAVGLVREMAENGTFPGLNASKVGFMGFSAGGHLTGHMNVAWANRTYPRVDAADDQPCKPIASMMVYPWQSVTQAPVNAPIEEASAANVTKDTPPTMLVQAEDDPVHVENAFYYWLALKTYGVPSELHLYPAGGHGYGRCDITSHYKPGNPLWNSVCSWPDRGTLFLQQHAMAPW